MEVLEKIPAEGDSFESDGLRVRVLKMFRKRIEQVEIERIPVETAEN